MVKINLKKGPDLRKFDPPNKPEINLDKKPKFNLDKKPEPPRRNPRDFNFPGLPKITDPQEGLEPILGNFYGSPPIDPRDCEIYPDSPWCGGNPFSINPISLDFSLVIDKCNIGVQLEAQLAFVKLPPVQIVYRNPDCRPDRPPPPSESEYEEDVPIPPGLKDSDSVIVFTSYVFYQRGTLLPDKTVKAGGTTINQSLLSVLFDDGNAIGSLVNNSTVPPSEDFYNAFFNYSFESKEHYDDGSTQKGKGEVGFYQINYFTPRYIQKSHDLPNDTIAVRFYTSQQIMTVGDFKQSGIKNFKSIKRDAIPGYPGYFWINDNAATYILYPLETTQSPLPPPPILPPPLPPPMSCCPRTRENDELLRLIAKRLGVYDYPVNVPKIFTDRAKGTESIENLTRLHTWQAKQLDALCGKYPIEVKIKDSDLTKQGDQPTTLKLPNIAEALAELLGLILLLKAESGATLSASVRAMIEAGSGKQAAILAHDYAKANAEFLGYSGKQIIRKVPFAFNFNKQKLDEMLKEGEFEIKGFDNDDKDDFNDKIMPLLDMAAMYKAANYRKVDAKDPVSGLKAILEGYNTFSALTKEAIDDPKVKKEKQEKQGNPNHKSNPENWDDFLRSAEGGFVEQPGIKNSTEPYDRPFDQRPKIREIGNDTSDTED